mmetsp:Transcript_120473/g.336109  ORF Transcript_120473/g.336109 Transcript_120473/m.336109 type:complete len:241 (-) Transcript_120473:1607-2329(-)
MLALLEHWRQPVHAPNADVHFQHSAWQNEVQVLLRDLEVHARPQQLPRLVRCKPPAPSFAVELAELSCALKVQETRHLEEPCKLVPQDLVADVREERAECAHIALELQRAKKTKLLGERRLLNAPAGLVSHLLHDLIARCKIQHCLGMLMDDRGLAVEGFRERVIHLEVRILCVVNVVIQRRQRLQHRLECGLEHVQANFTLAGMQMLKLCFRRVQRRNAMQEHHAFVLVRAVWREKVVK